MLIVSGTVTIDPADLDAALALVGPLVAATNDEPGCNVYGFFQDPDVPGSFRLFEEWESQDALDAHMQTPHMAAFNEGIGAIGIRGVEIHKYTVADKTPL